MTGNARLEGCCIAMKYLYCDLEVAGVQNCIAIQFNG